MIDGYVYALECEGFTKIGYSGNPEKRLKVLRCELKSPNGRQFISSYCLFATDYERSCHREVYEHLIMHERFNVSFESAVEVIKRMEPKGICREKYREQVYGVFDLSISKDAVITILEETVNTVNKYAKNTPIEKLLLNDDLTVTDMIAIQNSARKYRLMLLESLDEINKLQNKIGV